MFRTDALKVMASAPLELGDLLGVTGGIAGLVGVTSLGLGIFHPRVSLFGPVIWAGLRERHEVALTFDDGPHPEFTPRIAEALARHGSRATFFCVGEEVQRSPNLARELSAQGHELGNHTHRHNTGADLFVTGKLTEDLRRCQDVIATATGIAPTMYRPAVGIRNPVVHAAARAVGLTVVTWSRAARDGLWSLTPGRALGLAHRTSAGDIVALHDGVRGGRDALREATARELPSLIVHLHERGFQLVTVSDLLRP